MSSSDSTSHQHFWLGIASLSMMLSVAAGAWSAHGLEKMVSPDGHEAFDVGVRYQMWHSLALLALAVSKIGIPKFIFILISLGMLVFSGSLYILALTGVKTWGAVTPIGGSLLILSWLILGAKMLILAKFHK